MPSSFAERRAAALRQRTIELFGLPGDRCADPACRRQGPLPQQHAAGAAMPALSQSAGPDILQTPARHLCLGRQ